MLLIDLKMLDETIAFYESLSKDIQDQFDNYLNIEGDLFDNWQGVHAQTFHEKLSSLLYGPSPDSFTEGEAASLLAVKERSDKILAALKAGQEVFQEEMYRCEELFYYGLTSTESIYRTKPSSNTAHGGKLFIDYAKAEEIVMRLKSLMDNECVYGGVVQNSQMGSWNNVLSPFKETLKHSSYHPSYSDKEVRDTLEYEYTKIQNFWYSVVKYKEDLAGMEEALAKVFGEQTSDYAKGMTRQIYETSADGKINTERIRYLSQKSPDSFTPGEMDEIHEILVYTMKDVRGQENRAVLPSGQGLMQMQFTVMLDETSLCSLFRGYRAALNTKYAKNVSRAMDVNQLNMYFYRDTLKKLTTANGSLNPDQLKSIMELDPASLTAGDCRALSEVFDQQVTGTDMKAMEHLNLFLTNCYINDKSIAMGIVDVERSPVFDRWSKYYLGNMMNKTNDRDFKVLEGTGADERGKVNAKFLKQALLKTISSNAALKLQLQYGLLSKASESENPQMKIFDIESLDTGKNGDYHLTMYESYEESGKKIEIEYYAFRFSADFPTLFVRGMDSDYEKNIKGLGEYTKEKAADFVVSEVGGSLVGCAKGVTKTFGWALDAALKTGEYAAGWNGQSHKNKEVMENRRKYYDGLEMEAYQQSGQLMYVNGVKISNNEYVNTDRIHELKAAFERQIDPKNENYSQFFPEDCDEATRKSIESGLHKSDSLEYKNAFISWYAYGTGDRGGGTGRSCTGEGEDK